MQAIGCHTGGHIPGVKVYGLTAYSIRGMASLCAPFKRVLVNENYDNAHFYRLDVSGPSLAQTVLETSALGSAYDSLP